MTETRYPRAVIRRATHKGRAGFMVTKYDKDGRKGRYAPRVFVETREAAERCAARFKCDLPIRLGDMTAGTE